MENSEYIKYFERQSSDTRPIDEIKNYIIFDAVDTVIEVVTAKELKLIKIIKYTAYGSIFYFVIKWEV